MKAKILLGVFLFLTLISNAQLTVSGKVTDTKGHALIGATIAIKGTYDGVITDTVGFYKLKNVKEGAILLASYIGFMLEEKSVNTTGPVVEINFALKIKENELDGVVITAGTFETSDRKRSVTLQPLDIVTTPSSNGSIIGALTTLPGTAVVGEDGRLFVRGGDGYECKTFIDGLLSKKPYNSNVPDLPSRSRFSPFLFSGTTFSTGGYSAEYGQAMSSALILNTKLFPEKTQTQVSLMTVGAGISQVVKKKNTAFSLGIDYSNLGPYYKVFRTNRFKMSHYPESVGLTFTANQKVGKTGMFKLFSAYSHSAYGVIYPNLAQVDSMLTISIKNDNSYTNASYSAEIGKGWLLKSGLAFTYDYNNMDLQTSGVIEKNHNAQVKITLKKEFSRKFSFLFGTEETMNRFVQNYNDRITLFKNTASFTDCLSALYAEGNYKPINKLALQAGVRGEYSNLLNHENLAARLAAAFSINKYMQVSLAYGNFYQTPEESLLRFTHKLNFERANHYIINCQWERNDRLLRIELYNKQYQQLVRFNSVIFWDAALYNNNGYGYAQGVDVFFRDRHTFQNIEYWLSYSYVDSKRLSRDFPAEATPVFAPAHSASLVTKYWMQKITTEFGLSTTFATGRPYNNPNSKVFMDAHTPFYHDLSINASHLNTLWGKQLVVYAAINNVLGRNNIYGYRYYATPDANGVYKAFPLKSPSSRFFIMGCFLTI